MSEKKIDLDNIIEMYCQDEFHDGSIHFYKENLMQSYINFGKQLLELATLNAKIEKRDSPDGDAYYYIINKQSILDIIKQIR